MRLKKVINLFGGPSVGKSLIAAGVFHKLKVQQESVELVHEYAKELTYEKRNIVLEEDQLYIFAKQHRKLFRIRDEVDIAVTDSPILLPAIYYNYHGLGGFIYDKQVFHELVVTTFINYPNLNIVLERNPIYDYETHGREQSEEQSAAIDQMMVKFLDDNGFPYVKMLSDDNIVSKIVAMVEKYS